MRLHLVLCALASATDLKVEQYEGPTECDAAEKAKIGDKLSMHYTGTIDESSVTGTKGKQFDSSRSRQVFSFTLGKGQVIAGWDKGLVGLCKGAKARLVIPPELGYGAGGAGADIPGGATLNFDVEVMDISVAGKGMTPPNLFKQIDTDGNKELNAAEVEAFFEKKMPGKGVPDELWGKEDTNQDGVISWEEFKGPKGASKDEL